MTCYYCERHIGAGRWAPRTIAGTRVLVLTCPECAREAEQ